MKLTSSGAKLPNQAVQSTACAVGKQVTATGALAHAAADRQR
jgi:hypothetical protein